MLQVHHGSFGYSQDHVLFRDINLELHPGEVLAILGANGAGKTTFLKCMMGMLAWQNGYTKINDNNIQEMSHRDLWKILGYVPQAKGGYLGNSAREMVVLGRSVHLGVFEQPGKKDWEIVDQVMERVGITHLTDRSCNQISGGELQMVLIARALAAEPGILILDEPESNLDFKNQMIVLETIERLAKESVISCVINTHYPEHALRISDRTLLLSKKNGHVFGETKEVITEEYMEKAFDVRVSIASVVHHDKEYQYVLPISHVI